MAKKNKEYIVQVSSIMLESYKVKANSYDDAGEVWVKSESQAQEIQRIDPKVVRILEVQK
tara:strand:+ start:1997 stop:2176 length:180 start_codon:yes stop_codon:yes gene_type:complete